MHMQIFIPNVKTVKIHKSNRYVITLHELFIMHELSISFPIKALVAVRLSNQNECSIQI